jgi:hypothetical protein
MNPPPPGEDYPDPPGRSSGSHGTGWTVARWGLFAWLGRGLVAPAVLACVVGAAAIACLLAVFGAAATTVSDDVRYQCDSAIGPDRSASETATPAAEPIEVSVPPSENPYASLEPDDGDSAWERACFGALKDAPYQVPPVRAGNTGVAAECAARLALGQVGRQADQALLVKFVVYHASTENCELLPPVADAVDADVARNVDDLPPASTCPDVGAVLLLPDTVAAQGVCGQRVDLAVSAGVTAVSAGDLAFWDHRDNAPTRVGVAVGPTELVTVDQTTGLVVRQPIPVGDDVRVKRVLPLV